ncbi:cation:proton antiporter [Streptomyces hoynatensis]|uniref:Cation:proton antiporter n=1 Tax=Streptomyces hoynatensis TaxID=1141874 RepID=A0A3A9YZE0_9ACTN|nr:cation:proton antiporter [Streptomyces hoynatensis]RKN41315.1 cation:proton antiporter [Streptomyces hoynatensis]
MTPDELAPRFFAAAVVILVVCRLVSMAFARLGQPYVVGEMIAGVLLGPSLLGTVAPDVSDAIFPSELVPVIYIGGQIGLVALMLHVGYEFRSRASSSMVGSAMAISVAGMLVPIAGGVGLAMAAHGHVDIFVDGVSAWVTAAFVGVALAVTAFPMLARIITERGLSGTRYGSLSLASGASDDAAAWLMLAGVVSVASGEARHVLIAVGGTLLFALALFFVVRHFLAWVLDRPGISEDTRVLVTVAVLFCAAWFTDEIQLYSVFGAFCVGLSMPQNAAADRVVHTVHSMTRVVFLPMFFTYSGLRTEFNVFSEPTVLLFGAGAVLVAVGGKFGGCWAAARWRGEPPAVAVRVGTLMNARGLMQLIALNIGLDAGIVNRTMFAALVLVALVTTVMTSPVLEWLDRRDPAGKAVGDPAVEAGARRSGPAGPPGRAREAAEPAAEADEQERRDPTPLP